MGNYHVRFGGGLMEKCLWVTRQQPTLLRSVKGDTMQRMIRNIFILFLLGFFTVASAQLPPEIRADAYLLQAEQAIRNGDTFRAQAAIQNILHLQTEHELDLSDEFHFRYAKAADAVDLSDQALESVLKYLVASGREGQHYVEALALMNKVQTAVSCKGWDTEDYFKTATLEEVSACLDTGVDLNARDDAGATPLHRAVENTENPDVIKALLNAGADLKARHNDKRTPLHYAVLNKNTDIIEILLNAGADIEAQSENKRTPLYDAVFFKRPAAIKVLIEAGADTRGQDKWTSLHWAAMYNENPVAIQALLNAGADLNARADYTPLITYSQTPLHTAALFGNLVAIQALLNAGADPNAKDYHTWTPLHRAVKYSENPEIVKTLLNAGADPKARTRDKRTPLHFAAWNNPNPEIVEALFEAETDDKDRKKNRWALLYHAAKYNKNSEAVLALIEDGVDPDEAPFSKTTPLHWAVRNENLDVVKTLLNAGADPNARNRWKSTPLHRATRSNENLGIVKILLNAGADPMARDNIDWTPLHYAARNSENSDVIKVLIDAGADPMARSKEGWTPLHCAAASNENPDIIVVLVHAGANLEAQGYDDSTPLHEAAEHNENPDVIRILLSAGADLNAENKKGFTPLGLAVEHNENPEVVRVLRAAGASQTKIAGKSQEGDGFGKAAAALLGGAAIMYAGKDAADQEAVTETVREYMEGVLSEQPDGHINSAGTSSQTQGGQAQDPMQQALQNLENVCGEKYQGNFSVDDHARFFCLAAFNDYCALKRAKSDEAISKLRASLQQNCAVLKSVGADSKCSYCK